MNGWIGVDLDGTLAVGYPGVSGEIGPPVASAVTTVKSLLRRGIDVRIFTARAAFGRVAVKAVQAWCQQHLGCALPVTNVKTPDCLLILDDRAISVADSEGSIRSREAQLTLFVSVANSLAKF